MTTARTAPREAGLRVLAWLAPLATLLALLAAAVIFLFPPSSSDASRPFLAGYVDSFAPSSVTHFPLQHFWLVRAPSGEFTAFYDLDAFQQSRSVLNTSALACRLEWHDADYYNREYPGGGVSYIPGTEAGAFREPCQGNLYAPDGRRIYGPSPANLDTFAVRVNGGAVVVELGLRTCGQYGPGVIGGARRCNARHSP